MTVNLKVFGQTRGYGHILHIDWPCVKAVFCHKLVFILKWARGTNVYVRSSFTKTNTNKLEMEIYCQCVSISQLDETTVCKVATRMGSGVRLPGFSSLFCYLLGALGKLLNLHLGFLTPPPCLPQTGMIIVTNKTLPDQVLQ